MDKTALSADGVTDYFTISKDLLEPIIAYYTATISKINGGDASTAVSCEVSDLAARAKCLLAIDAE